MYGNPGLSEHKLLIIVTSENKKPELSFGFLSESIMFSQG